MIGGIGITLETTNYADQEDYSLMSKGHEKLAASMIGVWWLQSRLDTAEDGSRREEPSLGSDPLGILTYTSGRFAAQR